MSRSTKVLTTALLASIVLAVALSAQTNPDNPKFSLTIKTSKPEVTLGSDIDISITVTNLTEEVLYFRFGNRGNVAVGYQYDVRDEQGAPVALSEKDRTVQLPDGGTWHIPSPPGRSGVGGVPPGKNVQEGSKISDVYIFDHQGKYTIRVSRPATLPGPGKPEPERVYSNTITIAVLPAANKPSAEQAPPEQ